MIIVEVVFLAVFWTWAFCAVLFFRNTLLPRAPLSLTPSQAGLAAESVRFQASDGMWLEGWVVPGDSSRPWIICCHGVGSNRADLLDIAAGLHAAGLNLLLFDFRAHGGSRGLATSFGWHEQRDLEGALACLGRQADIPTRPYGVYGISMGGSVALMTAARDERIGAVAADSPYSDLEETLSRHLALMYPLPRVPFAWYVLATYRLRFGVWPRRVSPSAGAAQLHPRALLLIHGSQDIRMPIKGSRAMFKSAGEPKELWMVDGAGHLESFSMDPHAYVKRLSRFFLTHLT